MTGITIVFLSSGKKMVNATKLCLLNRCFCGILLCAFSFTFMTSQARTGLSWALSRTVSPLFYHSIIFFCPSVDLSFHLSVHLSLPFSLTSGNDEERQPEEEYKKCRSESRGKTSKGEVNTEGDLRRSESKGQWLKRQTGTQRAWRKNRDKVEREKHNILYYKIISKVFFKWNYKEKK